MTAPLADEPLMRALAEARARGFLGPGALSEHVDQAAVLAAARPAFVGRALDLGSGAGVPGLLLASAWPASRWVLLDAHRRRAAFAREAARWLDATDRVTVVGERAEQAAHDGTWRGQFDLVVARGFGPPATTAECGAPFLVPGGELVVSEPPPGTGGVRWPAAGLALLGLIDGGEVRDERGGWRLLLAAEPCPAAYPRRTGVPRQRPLF